VFGVTFGSYLIGLVPPFLFLLTLAPFILLYFLGFFTGPPGPPGPPGPTASATVLASFKEKEGPGALQELAHVLMALPVLKTEEAMLAAVHAQPQLQHLAKRYPHFLHTLGIFEDPKAIRQIKDAMLELPHSSMKVQGRKPSALAQAVQHLGKQNPTTK